MKAFNYLAAIALASCICFASCTKDEGEGTVTVNDVTYTKVTADCHENGHGLFFTFELAEGVKASGMIDTGIALEKTLHFGYEENNGGYGDWIALGVEYPGGKFYEAVPKSGTQTIKKNGKAYSIVIDGKDENDKVYKINVSAIVI